jgi:hypothetical protein
MATRYACQKCTFSIVLSGGRFLACPRCFSDLDITEAPDRPKRIVNELAPEKVETEQKDTQPKNS